MGDSSGVCEVVHTIVSMVSKQHRRRQEIVKDGIGVFDVYDMIVFDDLRNKRTRM